ncbi:hypothetical protein SynM161_01536 [Synechococcus sp. M16.1]|nr:hypothetical protein SynM161_01536 [Synechococcus sp. M16.1]
MTLKNLKHDSLLWADDLILTTDWWSYSRAAIPNFSWHSPEPSNLELMNLGDECWPPAASFANVIEVAINR